MIFFISNENKNLTHLVCNSHRKDKIIYNLRYVILYWAVDKEKSETKKNMKKLIDNDKIRLQSSKSFFYKFLLVK